MGWKDLSDTTVKKFKMEKFVERAAAKKCPFCGQDVDETSFRDALSLKEFNISGLCQGCQDDFFK